MRCIIIMFKQIGHIIIVAMLFIATTGFTMHQHYCMGNLVETTVFHEPVYCCEEGSDCCQNESETFQLKEDFVYTVQLNDFEDIEIDLALTTPVFTIFLHEQFFVQVPYYTLHPPDRSTELARLQAFKL